MKKCLIVYNESQWNSWRKKVNSLEWHDMRVSKWVLVNDPFKGMFRTVECYSFNSVSYLLVFQMWMVSSSTFSCFRACSSKKSKKYLTAGGTTVPGHNTLRKKSSTNCCSVPCNKNTVHCFPIHLSRFQLNLCVNVNEMFKQIFSLIHLHREQSGQVNLSDGFRRGLVFHTPSLWFHFVKLIRRSHQVKYFIVLQQSISCST